MPLVSIILLTYNSEKFLTWCLNSILKQAYPNIEIICIDNNSVDNSLKIIEQFFCSTKNIKLIKNKKNIGYASGHNLGIKNSCGEYILCLNPDVILEPSYIAHCLALFTKNKEIGAVTGKLFKFKILDAATIDKTNIIDSCGLKISRSHHVVEWGGGEIDNKNFISAKKVFGVSGAAPMFRRSALDQLFSFSGTFFDPDFFCYKEDLDLSFRLWHAGYECWFSPTAIGYHHRWGTGTQKDETAKNMLNRRQNRSSFVNFLSYRNHLYFLLKNEFLINIFWYFPFIFLYEFSKMLFAMFVDKNARLGLLDFAKNLSLTLKKRNAIITKSKIKSYLIRQLILSR